MKARKRRNYKTRKSKQRGGWEWRDLFTRKTSEGTTSWFTRKKETQTPTRSWWPWGRTQSVQTAPAQTAPLANVQISYPPLFGMDISQQMRQFNNFALYDDFKSFRIEKKWKRLPLSDPTVEGAMGVAKSVNGDIGLVAFTRNKVTVPAVIKKANRAYADNLMYEYKVGCFLNKYCSLLPCFVYTYGIYKDLTFPVSADFQAVPLYDDNYEMKKERITMETACDLKADASKKTIGFPQLYLLLQYIQKTDSFETFLKRFKNENQGAPTFYDVNCVLFQIYFALHLLYPNDRNGDYPYFEHNDLHDKNVLVKELQQELTFKFKMKTDLVVVFKTKYLAKMIDYGRCTYYENKKRNSFVDIKEVCQSKKCTPFIGHGQNCGFFTGFDLIIRHVDLTQRQVLIETDKYVPDSYLANHANVLPRNVEGSLFKATKFEEDGKEKFHYDYLMDEFKNYKELLKRLSENIKKYDPQHPGDGPTLVIDGINPMVFTPHGIPIDVPYEL